MPPILLKAIVLAAAAGAYYVSTFIDAGAADAIKVAAGTLVGWVILPQPGAAK